MTKPLPTVLYVCGHSGVKKGEVSFGNKCAYSHHGTWFARNGYVCLTIDTLQLGEIEGIHHGTRKFNRWWWMCRGYTPAGVEAWNCIRSLDYLETRSEVDRNCIGVTGRSGGGAYSWSILGLDDRVKAAAPVAGIVDLQSYVVDGAIEGHCDCMFFNNTYEWDYSQLASLAAPRPVLLSNTDKDNIFPLDGVLRIHDYTWQVYRFFNQGDHFGLQISEGPHKDISELQIAAFRWMNRFLKNEDPPIEMPAAKLFTPEQLQVFKELPTDEINTKIDEQFVPQAQTPELPQSTAAWTEQRDRWIKKLEEMCFRAWPKEKDIPPLPSLELQELASATHDDVQLQTYEFTSQSNVKLPLWVFRRNGAKPSDPILLEVLDQKRWPELLASAKPTFPAAFAKEKSTGDHHDDKNSRFAKIRQRLINETSTIAFFAPRGIGLTVWNTQGRRDVEIRRRFLLLGQTLDGMQAFDIRRACQALRSIEGQEDAPLRIEAYDQMAGNALYASLFESNISQLDLHGLPNSHNHGPYYLNVLRVLDVPQALAMAVEHSKVNLDDNNAAANSPTPTGTAVWNFARGLQNHLGWPAEQLVHSSGP